MPSIQLVTNSRRQVWWWFVFPLVCWSVFPLHTPHNCDSTRPQPWICCWTESQSQERDKHKNKIFEGWTTVLHIPLWRMQSILPSQAAFYLKHLKTTRRSVVTPKFVLQNCLCWPKHKVAWKENITSTKKKKKLPSEAYAFLFPCPWAIEGGCMNVGKSIFQLSEVLQRKIFINKPCDGLCNY